MAIGVDSSKWKPRRISGTPAGRASVVISVGVLSIGVLSGAFCLFSDFMKNCRKNIEVLYEDPEEEVERKLMIASGLHRSGNKIRKLIEEEARPDLPYK